MPVKSMPDVLYPRTELTKLFCDMANLKITSRMDRVRVYLFVRRRHPLRYEIECVDFLLPEKVYDRRNMRANARWGLFKRVMRQYAAEITGDPSLFEAREEEVECIVKFFMTNVDDPRNIFPAIDSMSKKWLLWSLFNKIKEPQHLKTILDNIRFSKENDPAEPFLCHCHCFVGLIEFLNPEMYKLVIEELNKAAKTGTPQGLKFVDGVKELLTGPTSLFFSGAGSSSLRGSGQEELVGINRVPGPSSSIRQPH